MALDLKLGVERGKGGGLGGGLRKRRGGGWDGRRGEKPILNTFKMKWKEKN